MFEKYLDMPAGKWLRLIENESLRTKVINHTMNHPGNPGLMCSSINEALFHAFSWEKTDEGEFYWLNVYNSKINLKNTELTTITQKTKRADLLIVASVAFSIGIASYLFF